MAQVHFYAASACATLIALSKAAPDCNTIKARGKLQGRAVLCEETPTWKTFCRKRCIPISCIYRNLRCRRSAVINQQVQSCHGFFARLRVSSCST